MVLSAKERITLLGILPGQGNFRTLSAVQKLRDNLIFTEQEAKTWEIRQEEDRVFWNPEKTKDVDIQIGEIGLEVIEESLSNLDKDKKLTTDHLSLWDKFIENKKEG